MRWVEISISAAESSVDAVANILTEEGCNGAVIGPTLAADPTSSNHVSGYLPVDDTLEAKLLSIRERIHMLSEYGLLLESDEITIKWIQDEEWATAWKKHFKPVRIGKIIIKPTWEEYAALPGDIIVDIDPGMAFGTGYHPTTQLCILALQDYIKGGESVLDVGTGSGVLAIAAARLGARSVVGLDIDSVAVEVAIENIKQAELEDIISIRQADSSLAFSGEADFIVANIIAKVLVDMSEELASKLKPNGKLLASGIVIERAEDVRKAFSKAGLKIIDERVDGDWVALICERIK